MRKVLELLDIVIHGLGITLLVICVLFLSTLFVLYFVEVTGHGYR